MHSIPIAPFACTAAWAAAAAIVVRHAPPWGAAVAAAGVLLAVATRWPLRRTGLIALPVVLAAWAPPAAPAPLPAPGPHRLRGEVTRVVRAPLEQRAEVTIGRNRPLRLSFEADVPLLPGDRVDVLVRASPAPIPGGPPRLTAAAGTLRITPGPPSVRRALGALRRALEQRLLQLVPGPNGALLTSLVLGRETRPERDITAAHRATGLSHLLAVSGAHAATLAFLLGLSSRGAQLAAGRRRVLFVLLVLFVYGAIAGAEPPVLRAVVACVLAALAARRGRPFGITTALLAPAVATSLVQPEALLGPSFLLSYAAVVGLALAGRTRRGRSWWQWFTAALRASAWATLLTAPLTLGFFQQLAPWTVLLTPLCAPLVAVLLLLGLVAATLALLAPTLASACGPPLALLTELYTGIVRAADLLPATPVHASYAPPAWSLVATGTVAAAALVLWPRRATVATAAVVASLVHFVPLRPPASPAFTLFAVGHGQAALATTADGRRIAIDCGSLHHPGLAAGELSRALTVRSLDLLVITHADHDHHNGVPSLLERLPVRRVVLPKALLHSPLAEALRQHGAAVETLAPGERRRITPFVELCQPWLPPDASDNDTSLWVRLEVGSSTVLLGGDAEQLGIAAALASGFLAPCDVLVLPHHGRSAPNVDRLLAAVRPRSCLASNSTVDGEGELAALVRRFDADPWSTGVHGTLTLDGDPPHLRTLLGVRPLPERRVPP